MSKASRQSLAMLSMITGVFITIDNYSLAPELAATIHYGLDVCCRCVDDFPETGDRKKNEIWCRERLQKVEDDFNNSDTLYSMIVLTSMATLIIKDLTEIIRNKKKLELLEPVEEVIEGLSNQIDPKGDQFEAYEEAEELLKKFYSAIEFVQTDRKCKIIW